MPELSRRVGAFTDSVIRRMTRISDETPGSINLSQGFPDFDPPQAVLDAMRQMSGSGEQHQYPVTFGSKRLRDCIAAKYSPRAGRQIDPEEEVVVTCGGTEAMMAASLPGAWERTITCNSLSKTFSITGWRIGFVLAAPEVSECIKRVHDFLTIGAPAPLQEAICAGFTLGQGYYDELKASYTKKRKLFCEGLDSLGLPHSVPQGSYFVMVDISPFLRKPKFAGWSDLQFCEWMIREVGVAAVPGSSFFAEDVNNLIRLHFARSEESLTEAINRLMKLKKYL